ncbi:MAG: protein kinase [Pyrinomonadaceae bacterium]|nr:protein kinase [Pyrinomonadaceae bacterium]
MLQQGEILRGRYKVIRQLGQGGMGAVYEAHDNVFETSVALKQVTINLSSAYDTKAQEMAQLAFEREAKILAKVNHENIPHVKDYFTEDDAQFLVMELVDGDDLGKLLNERRSPFPISTIMEWTDRLLDALDYLHSQDPPVIHRDIKPQNLKITSRQKIKLLDFGIAKGTDAKTADTVSNKTFIAATLNYSPLEQMLRVLDPTFLAVITHKYGEKIEPLLEQTADVRSDLFALGATMYHLATNTAPAEAVKRAIDIWDGKQDPLVDPISLNSEISPEFSRFLIRSMKIRREERFANAAEMRSELHKIIEAGANPTLKQTVQLGASDFPSDPTLPQIPSPFHGEKTAILSDIPQTQTGGFPPSPETVSFPVKSSDTGGEGYLPPETGAMPVAAGFQAPAQTFSAPAEQKRRSALIWLVPIAGVLLLMIAGGAVGVWYFVVRAQPAKVNGGNPNSTVVEASPSPTATPQPEIVGGTADLPETESTPDKTPAPSTPETAVTKPGADPRPQPTPKPVVAKPTPVRRATPKPKNMDCIFTDDC